MAKYYSDLEDVEFNLFHFLKIQNFEEYGLDANDMKGILIEYDKFIENEIFPSREPSDLEGVRHENGNVIAPESLKKFHKAYHDNGWFSLGLPEAIGGTPVPEALAMGSVSLATGANTAYAMYPGLSKAALNVINLKGTDEMKNRYIPKMMEGLWSGTMCLTEAGAGSDVGALRTTANPNDDGSYNIKGVKIFISGGDSDLYENTVHLVLAKTPGAEEGTKGISLFVVPKHLVNDDQSLGDFNNVACTKIEHKMGIHASATCELTFGGEGDCKGWLIGDEFDGMATMFIMMNEARILCGIQGEAQANLAYLMAENYAKERVQFGTEISNHPDVKRMLFKMRASARGLRALILYTANLFDEVKEKAELQGRIELLTPICKAYTTEEGLLASLEAVQVHGGYGYCQEYGVEQFVRDTVIAKIYEGTNGIQAMDFVMRKILKDQGQSITLLLKDIGRFVENLNADYQYEQSVFGGALKDFQNVLGLIQKQAGDKDFNPILENCFDTLMMASHLTTAWLLGRHALEAQSADVSEKLKKTKKEDFSIYCRYFLTKNAGLAQSMLGGGPNVSSLEL